MDKTQCSNLCPSIDRTFPNMMENGVTLECRGMTLMQCLDLGAFPSGDESIRIDLFSISWHYDVGNNSAMAKLEKNLQYSSVSNLCLGKRLRLCKLNKPIVMSILAQWISKTLLLLWYFLPFTHGWISFLLWSVLHAMEIGFARIRWESSSKATF